MWHVSFQSANINELDCKEVSVIVIQSDGRKTITGEALPNPAIANDDTADH